MSEATATKGYRIALDCMGGDLGPSEAVAAAALAFKEGVIGPADTLLLVGHEDNLRLLAREHRILNKPERVFYRHAPTAVAMDDAAMAVLKSKRDSSMVKALEMLKAGEADVVVSTGNTKALVAAGTIKVRPMEGAERPALAAIMPRREGHFIMLDVGANPEAKPEHLLHNAVLGSIYAQCSLGIANRASACSRSAPRRARAAPGSTAPTSCSKPWVTASTTSAPSKVTTSSATPVTWS